MIFYHRIFIRGQFWPSGIVIVHVCLAVYVCLSLCVSVNPELVRAINHHAFKLEPPNLDKRCKTAWLGSLFFFFVEGGGGGGGGGAIDIDLQGQINSKSQIYPTLSLSTP